MSRYVEGAEVARIEYIDGPSGNPCYWEKGLQWCKGQSMVFHMQEFGDHGIGWLLTLDNNGGEIERRAAKSVDRIVWLRTDQSTTPERGAVK